MNVKYDLKIDEAIAQIIAKIDDEICDKWKIKREDVIKSLQAQQRIDKAIVKLASISSDDLKDIKIMVKKLKDIKSILQSEEAKDND